MSPIFTPMDTLQWLALGGLITGAIMTGLVVVLVFDWAFAVWQRRRQRQ